MKPDLLAQLSRPQREAVESAGYRVTRWAAARAVLQARVAKGRIGGGLGDFLAHWLPPSAGNEGIDELWLSFAPCGERIKLVKSGAAIANEPLECALLHLPALRTFWSQELRQQHFAALKELVPQSWLLDGAPVPPGAVIGGLNSVSWEQALQMPGRGWEIRDRSGLEVAEWRSALAGRECVLAPKLSAGAAKFSARYLRNDKGQVVLHSIEEASS